MSTKIESFANIIKESWKSKELRKRILFTIMLLIIFRIGSNITIPGVHVNVPSTGANENGIISSLGILGGGGLKYFSIFALGVSPYITASIIIQLLSTNVVPYLTNLSKSGEKGRKTQDLITRLLTLPLAILQSIGIVELLVTQNTIDFNNKIAIYVFIVAIQIAGTFLALWMGDQINEHGLGNGVSMIILSGVVASIPFNFFDIFKTLLGNNKIASTVIIGIIEAILLIIFYFFLIFITTLCTQSYRYIPVKNIGSGLTKKDDESKSYVVLRLNTAGVIPVIFAIALLSVPLTIAKYVGNAQLQNIFNYLFNRQYPTALIVYFIFIVLFTYFYSIITINPERFAENLQKNGSFIPGISPGYQSAKFIKKILNRLNFYGALFLGIISIIPYILSIIFKLPPSYGIGGTGMIIFVAVSINLFSQIRARLTQIEYKKLKVQGENEFGIW